MRTPGTTGASGTPRTVGTTADSECGGFFTARPFSPRGLRTVALSRQATGRWRTAGHPPRSRAVGERPVQAVLALVVEGGISSQADLGGDPLAGEIGGADAGDDELGRK